MQKEKIPTSPTPAFAASGAVQTLGEEGSKAAVAQVLDGLSAEVKAILAQATAWPAAQAALEKAFPALDGDAFAALMARALAAAELAGMAEAGGL